MTLAGSVAAALAWTSLAAASLPTAALAQTSLPFGRSLQTELARIGGFAGLSFALAALVALLYRWYTRESIPREIPLLLGTAAVAFYLGVVGIFDDIVVGNATELFSLDVVLKNLFALGVAAAVTPLGRRLGDRVATDVFAVAGARDVDAEVSQLVRQVGRVTTVELPETVEDIDGYDPVPAKTKAALAGKTLLFPRRQSIEERRDRLATRLKEDYGVGYVDAEFDDDGRLTYLAVGSRVAGVGPTLGPGTVAVAVRADPPTAASPGDTVQVWTSGADPTRVLTADLRATVDDVVTLAVDEAEAERLSAAATYRLVTLPADPQAAREFATLLRTADETMAAIELAPGSDLVGETIGSIPVTVAAVRPADQPVELLPARSRTLEPADTLYVVARPEALRRLEAAGAVRDGPDDRTQSS